MGYINYEPMKWIIINIGYFVKFQQILVTFGDNWCYRFIAFCYNGMFGWLNNVCLLVRCFTKMVIVLRLYNGCFNTTQYPSE